MMQLREAPRNGLAGLISASIVLITMCYLTFVALQGEYGLFRLFQVQANEKRLQNEILELSAERLELAAKTSRLSQDSIDLDLLDEQSRIVLGLARQDEAMLH